MEVQCPKCKVINSPDARFCAQCGAQLSPQKILESQPPESLFGQSFEPPDYQTSAGLEVVNPDSGGKSSRPTTLPEQGQAGFPPPVAATGAIISATASPSGVAFESSGGMDGGRPMNLPENQAGKTAGATAPKFAATGNRIIGEVREFRPRNQREGQLSMEIWSFRVERYDASGNRLQPVPVEMKGERFDGSISEGDWVELPGHWKPGEVAHPDQVNNLTTGATVRGSVTTSSKIGVTCGWIIFAVFLLAAGSFLLWIILSIIASS
jgi:hypothetical protein